MPDGVKSMALTATASPLTRECIIQSLFMIQPKVVYVTPQKKNIVYFVQKQIGIEDFVRNIATQILAVGKYMPYFANNMISAQHYYTLLGGCYVYSSTINQLPTQEGVKVRISTVVRANN